MKDFARLDLAVCRLEGRIELHSLMHLQHCAFAWLGVELNDVVARWMIAHNLRCREVSLSQELLRNRPLRKQLFSQMGNSVESVNVCLTNYKGKKGKYKLINIRKLFKRVFCYCTNLLELHLSVYWDKYQLSSDDFTCFAMCMKTWSSLQQLTLTRVLLLPRV